MKKVWRRKRETMEILKVENLSKVYGTDENKVMALNDVSFSVSKGEFVAIIGQAARENQRCYTFWGE